MRQNLRLGHVAGIAVGAHWSTVVIAVLIGGALATAVLPQAVPGQAQERYWLVSAGAAILFLASLLAHELAHALVARRRGVPVKSITLWLLGGVTEFAEDTKSPKAEFQVAVAGPLTSLVLCGVFYLVVLLVNGPALVVSAVRWLAVMNGVLAVFNMLPGTPLDGGRVLHAALWSKHGSRTRADRTVARAGQGLGMALIAVGAMQLILMSWTGGLWMMLIGWFLSSAARSEGLVKAAQEGLRGWHVRDVMTASPDLAPAWQDVDDFISTVALRSHQTVFPVVDFAGEPAGVLSLDVLSALAPEQRRDRRVSTLARPVPPDHLLSPDDDATRILAGPAAGELMGVVTENGHVVGMVTTADVTRALRQAVLRATSAEQPAPAPRTGSPGRDTETADGTGIG
ncbi:site-2 protease family protein [Sphaerisporangium fuscum]|uniref:site-2 protease family protein n=1 Tax=Sphaerisporangium fuscum TaxID=2835868 RepID=UPI001BDCC373|nr:site-2 protease family protein [Sphaerisporangium fuscum]